MRRYLKIVAVLGFAALAVGLPAAAQARVFVGVRLGAPFYGPAYYPGYYPAYYPAPVYYPPPAVAYAPPPAVVAPTPIAAPVVAAPQTGNCRQYRGDATIDGRNQPFYGTACLQADGRWHIVN